MKKTLLTFVLLGLFATFGCGTRMPASLGQFVGTWQGTYTILNSKGARVSSGTMTVKQPAPEVINFGESTSVVTGVGMFGVPNSETKSFDVTLKQGSNNYLLSLKNDGEVILSEFPLTYSDSDGFNGQGSVSLDGKQRPVTASIKKDGAGFTWKISADESTGPKHLYEFTFKEKK